MFLLFYFFCSSLHLIDFLYLIYIEDVIRRGEYMKFNFSSKKISRVRAADMSASKIKKNRRKRLEKQRIDIFTSKNMENMSLVSRM